MSLCSLFELKFDIYDISYTMFYPKSNIFYTVGTNLIMFLYKKEYMIDTCKLNFGSLFSPFPVNLSTRNFSNVVSMLFSKHR